MLKSSFLLLICFIIIIHGKRRAAIQSQHNLGDFCMPGTCTSINSNCKRIGGNAFRCVCKDQYMALNKTHCVRVINSSIDETCESCIKRHGICLDENFDDRMDKCFCPLDNDLCNERSTTYFLPVTLSLRKNIIGVTPLAVNRFVGKQGDLILSLYDINQQRLIDNGGSVSIGDRLFLEIKYRTNNFDINPHQIIAENCSISSSVSDNDIKLEKIQLLTNRCPTYDSYSSISFQRIDPYHIKSTNFQVKQFQTTAIVYLRCSIAICYDEIEHCQERSCQETYRSRRMNLTSFDENKFSLKRRRYITEQKRKYSRSFDYPYEIRQVQQQFSIEAPLPQPTNKNKPSHEVLYGHTSLGNQGAIERSTIIAAISIIFIIGISVSLFIIYRSCYSDYIQKIYGSTLYGGYSNQPESIYGDVRNISQACRYDMGRRSEQRFDESFFVNNVEALGAYRRQY